MSAERKYDEGWRYTSLFLLLYRDFVPGGVFFGAMGTFWRSSVPAALMLGTKRVCFVPGGGYSGTMGTFWHLCVPAAPLQFYSLANKSFFFDGLQHLWEGFKEVAGAFDGVVEDDYGAGLKVGDYVAGAGVAVDVAVVVPADDVPHYVMVSFVQYPCLVGTNAGIWGAEEV